MPAVTPKRLHSALRNYSEGLRPLWLCLGEDGAWWIVSETFAIRPSYPAWIAFTELLDESGLQVAPMRFTVGKELAEQQGEVPIFWPVLAKLDPVRVTPADLAPTRRSIFAVDETDAWDRADGDRVRVQTRLYRMVADHTDAEAWWQNKVAVAGPIVANDSDGKPCAAVMPIHPKYDMGLQEEAA